MCNESQMIAVNTFRSYYALAPDSATLNLEFELLREPVLMENPFTLGLNSLMISRSDVKNSIDKSELSLRVFDTYLEGLSLHLEVYLHQY